MNKDEKLRFQQQVEAYLERKRVYDFFQRLVLQLVVHRPDSPLDYLIDIIENPPRHLLTS